MLKRLTYISVCIIIMILFVGCGNSIPDMSDEQKELVVEYAAGAAMKHSENSVVKLVKTVQEEAVAEIKAEQEIQKEAEAAAESRPDNLLNTENSSISESANTEPIYSSIQSFLGINSLEFKFTGFEVTKLYPKNGTELGFVMNATDENQFLIVNFEVTNISQENVDLDMVGSGIRFKIKIGDSEKNALTTMLVEDMANYQETIAAGETVPMILVIEETEQQLAEINTVSLIIKSAEGSAELVLQ